MAFLSYVQTQIDIARGRAAQVIGQSYSVYRLNGSSTGQIVQSSNLITPTPIKASFKKISSPPDTETNMIIKVPLFRCLVNIAAYQVGDVFVESGYRSDFGAFTLAYMRPMRQYVFVQTPLPVTLSRSEPNPTPIDSGRMAYSGMMKSYEQFLVLNSGMYSWSTTGTPAAVYIGLQAHERPGSMPPTDLRIATDVARQTWYVYTANLPGVQVVESDIVNAANGDRYYVRNLINQYVGFQGIQMVTEKLRV